jgi:energy-converting hydrogenase B subunit D
MIGLELLFDALLAFALIWLTWRVLATSGLYQSVILFIVFGLLMALAWVRLDAPDIALAEAAIGAGITGALLLDAVAHFRRHAGER